jgi:hypothetical protein
MINPAQATDGSWTDARILTPDGAHDTANKNGYHYG